MRVGGIGVPCKSFPLIREGYFGLNQVLAFRYPRPKMIRINELFTASKSLFTCAQEFGVAILLKLMKLIVFVKVDWLG